MSTNPFQKASRDAVHTLRAIIRELPRKAEYKYVYALASVNIGCGRRTFDRYMKILTDLGEIKIESGYVYKPNIDNKIRPLRRDIT